MKKLIAIGTGPGDEKYLTLLEIESLKNANIIFVPKSKGKNRALDTVKNFIEEEKIVYLDYPMGNVDEETYKNNAITINNCNFKKACFVTIGDAMIYSTFWNTIKFLDKTEIEIESKPGIPSFLAAFNKTLMPMTEKGDNFLLTDGDFEEVILNYIDSIAILKTGKRKEEYLNLLDKYNFEYVYVKRLSDEDEEILKAKEEILKDSDYISLIIGRKRK